MDKAGIEELKSLIAVSRKRPLSFGVSLASKPEDTVFLIHRMKTPEMLGKAAKKEGGGKMSFGEASTDGKELSLTLLGPLQPGMSKKIKLMLRLAGLKMSVIILGPDGEVLEQEAEEEDEGADQKTEAEPVVDAVKEPPTAPVEAKANPNPAAAPVGEAPATAKQDPAPLFARLKILNPEIRKLENVEAQMALFKELKQTIQLVGKADYPIAEAAVVDLEAKVAQQRPNPASEPVAEDAKEIDIRPLMARAKSLTDVIATMEGPVVDRLNAALNAVIVQIEARNIDIASAGLDKLEAAINKLRAAAPKPVTDGGPDAKALSQQVNGALTQMTPEIRAAVTANPGLRAEVAALIEAARTAGDDESKANAALDALRDLVSNPNANTAGGFSLVKLGKARIEWIGVRDTSLSAIEDLKAQITDFYSDFPSLLPKISTSIAKLSALIVRIDNNLHEQLDVVLNAKDEETRLREIQTAKSLIGGLNSFIDSDSIAKTIDDNPFDKGLRVVAPIRSKLSEISAALG
jgi:hypothetical protein